MLRVPRQTLDDPPEGTRPTLERLSRQTGKPHNTHAEIAQSPVALAAYAGFTTRFNHNARTELDVSAASAPDPA